VTVYRTTFPIGASAATVWKVLTDFERYSQWNPSLPSIRGELRPGATVALTLGMPGRPSPKVTAELGDVNVGRRLTWHGNAGADWLFAGDREFVIDEQPDATVLFTYVEDAHGALFPTFRAFMGRAIQRSHDAFNAALKARAEVSGRLDSVAVGGLALRYLDRAPDRSCAVVLRGDDLVQLIEADGRHRAALGKRRLDVAFEHASKSAWEFHTSVIRQPPEAGPFVCTTNPGAVRIGSSSGRRSSIISFVRRSAGNVSGHHYAIRAS